MRRLQKEIDEIVSKRGSISNVSWEDIDSCNYLSGDQRIITTFPSIGTVAPRILTEDVEIDNILCPKVLTLQLPLWLHIGLLSIVLLTMVMEICSDLRDGKDRLRRQKDGIKFPSNDYSFITFSAGVRPCMDVTCH